ncbi:MAG: methyltransferase domain-containing protein [Proteobacteria bacterium]|nr:methyltransferase domain-containing protein [Pseudomonadota bacterium]
MAEIRKNPISSNIGDRVKAWWNGEEGAAGRDKTNESAKPQQVEAAEDFPSPSGVAEWTPQRIASIQSIYGDGVDSPSGRERTRNLINPIGLNEKMTVLDIGARLGTTARLIAKETGAWVDGIEQNAALVQEAARLSAIEGLAKKAVIRQLELNDPEITSHKRDAIIMRETLHQITDRDRLFKTLSNLLKPSSHLLITDFLTVPSKGKNERAEWNSLHRTTPQLYALDELRDGLQKVGFDVRIAKDETKAYMAMLLNDVRSFSETLQKGALPRELLEWVMWEVEYWARTYQALQAGGITLHRIHAVTRMEDPTKL